MATPITSSTVNSGDDIAPVSQREQSRVQLNVAIVQSSLEVSIGAKNEPMALLFKSAVDSLNKVLEPTMGENAIQNAVSQDNTPEGTAGRIVSLSTGFYAAYRAQHPDLNDNEALVKFMAVIRGGFEQGFKEATDILQGLNVLGGDIASNIDKTYALVQKGYDDFIAANTTPTASASTADSVLKT